MTAQNIRLARRADHEAAVEQSLEAFQVLDLVHLSRQTLGDVTLETELLALFQSQARQFAKRLAGPSHPGDEKWRAELAHTLKGSARAVGAFRVAQAAENYEYAVKSGSTQIAGVLGRLSDAIEETRAEIAGLLERA
jgi:HPt (histidine-containing phosphotransfer) domain-containing protein